MYVKGVPLLVISIVLTVVQVDGSTTKMVELPSEIYRRPSDSL